MVCVTVQTRKRRRQAPAGLLGTRAIGPALRQLRLYHLNAPVRQLTPPFATVVPMSGDSTELLCLRANVSDVVRVDSY
jgi:hypothetical protein